MSKKDKQIYCVVLNKLLNNLNQVKCRHLIENKHGNDRCNFRYGVLFSNKPISDTCKNWDKTKKSKSKIEYLPEDLFEI